MLSSAIREQIKATVPVLKEHGLALTQHFYQRMFSHHPELKNIFNQAHQHNSQQQQALAMAVLAYAEHIDNPSVLAPVLSLIANKHASLGVKAEHYPIVGEHLLASIRELLGAAATEALIDAWAAAYGQLADMLIAAEAQLYQTAAATNQGWAEWRSFRIAAKEPESDEITSFYLTPELGNLPSFKVGQYVSVRVSMASGLLQPRQYSLSDAPGQNYLRISVKREAATDMSVSNLLHDQFQEGDLLELSPPMGDFYLHEERQTPVVLLSGGVGVTPMLAMLNQLINTKSPRQVAFVHACRHGRVQAMKRHLQQLRHSAPQVQQVIFYEQPQAEDVQGRDFDVSGRISWPELQPQLALANADYYLCGPRAFMHEQKQQLVSLGVRPDRIHTEVFGSGGF